MTKEISIDFGICEVCGKKDGRPGHDCDGGEALRKAARELFGPAMDLVERVIAKAGTGVLRGVFEVAAERDALRAALTECHDAFVQWDILPADRCRQLRKMLGAVLAATAK